jgi:hypothetical protein
MTIEEVKQAAETYLASLQTEILPLQATYLGGHGRYWQGLETPRPVPSDGNDGTPDPNVSRGSLPSWSDFGVTLPASAPFAVSVNEQSYPGTYRAYNLRADFNWGPGSWTGKVEYTGGAWGSISWSYIQWPPS